MVKLVILETEQPMTSLIFARGEKKFAYRFRPYSQYPKGSEFKVFTTIHGTEISVDECHVNDEGEVIFRVKGDVEDGKAFVKDWIEREGWKVENPNREETLAIRRWRLRVKSEELLKEIREEKTKTCRKLNSL